MIIPMLAIAGNLARKKYVPPSLGTFPVTTPLFTVLLIGVILIVGALTFFPALSLGPILEHLLMWRARPSEDMTAAHMHFRFVRGRQRCLVIFYAFEDQQPLVHPGIRRRVRLRLRRTVFFRAPGHSVWWKAFGR